MHFEIIKPDLDYTYDHKVIKVGILPFIKLENTGFHIMVMKPFAEKEILGNPDFQIAKGTRRINVSGGWCDMREDDLIYADASFHEPLIETALREGNEEIGLKSHNIKKLYDCGVFSFISASKGIRKPLYMFAAEISDSHDFEGFEATTAETQWFSVKEFESHGRKDHIEIVNSMFGKLQTVI